MFGPEGFWDFIRSLRLFFGGGGVEYPPGDYSCRKLWFIFCHLGGGGTVAIDKSKILSAEQITANLHAIYNVLCWSLCQVNAKYSPQILTNLS